MKLIRHFTILLLFIASNTFSQTTTFELKNIQFYKTESGFLIYGNKENMFSVTKYDINLKKINEYTIDLVDYKKSRSYFEKIDDYYQLSYAKNRYIKTTVQLDTSLNVLYQKDDSIGKAKIIINGPGTFYDESSKNPPDFFYKNKRLSFDKKEKNITISKSISNKYELIYNYKINCNEDIDIFYCQKLKEKIYFVIKTKSNLKNDDLTIPIGESFIGEIDAEQNKVKYLTKITHENTNLDFIIRKLFFDNKNDLLLISGSYLDKEKYKNEKKSKRSEKTGCFLFSLDKYSNIKNKFLYQNLDTIYDLIPKSMQIHRSTIIKAIINTNDGYDILAEFSSHFNTSSNYYVSNTEMIFQSDGFSYNVKYCNSCNLNQPFEFHKISLNQKLELKSIDHFPIKNYKNKNESFEEIKNSNSVLVINQYLSSSFLLTNYNLDNIIYTYNNNYLKINKDKNIEFIEKYSAEYLYGCSFFEFSNQKYYILYWGKDKITFKLMDY